MTIQEIDEQISVHQNALNELRTQRQQLIDEQDALKVELQAAEHKAQLYENEANDYYDGLKDVIDYEHPCPLTLPKIVRKNIYYKYNDGLKDIYYVYMGNEQNRTEILTEWNPN